MLPSVIDCPDVTFLEATLPEPVRFKFSPPTKLLKVEVRFEVFASVVPS